MIKKITLLTLFFLFGQLMYAQAPKRYSSSDLHEAIKKLNVLGSALYVAAHPDDENTRMIAYMANEVKANTAYLSMTRGDGGQNLVGPEIQEQLGLIRTQELLAARRTDGGNQLFTRANDFGYSKNPEETLKIWNKEEVLSDVVWAIRKWQPDIIINRFSHDTGRRTHGHHTSSAILSVEAFDLAGDKNAFPEQLKYVNVWQPRRQFFNTSWWFYGSRENFNKADKSRMLGVDVGVYYPIKGKSNTEIAAESRSFHKSQGFGATGTRGMEMEYLQLLKGDMPKNRENPFDGINTTWSRVKDGEHIGKILAIVEKEFSHENPSASIPKLLEAYKGINALADGYWKNVKLKEVTEVIRGCLALYIEAVAGDYSATLGEAITLNVEAINRSPVQVKLKEVEFLPTKEDTLLDLDHNQRYRFEKKINLPKDMDYTSPYWLQENGELGMYTVKDQLLRGLPETKKATQVIFKLEIEGVDIDCPVEVVYKRNDPVGGEMYRPFEITPPAFARIKEKIFVFTNERPQEVEVLLKAGKPDLKGNISLRYGDKWKVEPEKYDFELGLKGEEQIFTFKVHPPAEQDENFISPLVQIGEDVYDSELVSIEYDHIPIQTVLKKSASKTVKIDLKKAGNRVAYIMGAGDAIPASLQQMGYDVDILEDAKITAENLKNYDALVIGVRAFNTVDRLKFHQPKLLEYVKNGGTMIVQYNTSHRLVMPMKELAPYPLQLSRDRVSVEEAEVRFLAPDHEVLNFPNKITEKDFEGWIQERGLYFPNEWDEQFTAILSSNDPGEPPRDGGMLVAKYGEGYYIYSGYSWFRELPAGVAGAYRIFANMLSIGKKPKP